LLRTCEQQGCGCAIPEDLCGRLGFDLQVPGRL
jgi:hypothetical protein